MAKAQMPLSPPTTADDRPARTESDPTVIIEIPISNEIPPSTFGIHIETRLNASQATLLRRVALELDRKQARLANGKRVVSPTDALKFILEQASQLS